ncbi:hypothetical protein pb186bvf_010757 [Paramecium bursaria]
MGNADSKDIPLKDFKFVNVIQDEAYGDVQVFQKGQEQVALFRIGIHEDQGNRIKSITDKSRENPANLTKIQYCQQQQSTDLCSNINIIQIALEYIEKSLQQDMLFRRKQKINYHESQIWFLIQNVLNGLSQYQSAYYDLHPNNIRITNDGKIKLIDLSVLPNAMPAANKIQNQLRQLEYLSPEQMYLVSNETQDPTQIYNYEKINIFSLGVICLSCLSQTEAVRFYNNDTNEYRFDISSQKIRQVFMERPTLSDGLRHTIQMMLDRQAVNRPSYQQLLDNFQKLDPQKQIPNFYSEQFNSIQQSVYIENNIQNNHEQIRQDIQLNPTFEKHNLVNNKQESLTIVNQEIITPAQPDQSSLDKLKQLKERFQALKGDYQQTTINNGEQYHPILQNKQIFQPNFNDMDPVIQRALNKSREVLSKCQPYQMSEQLYPITGSPLVPSQYQSPQKVQQFQTIQPVYKQSLYQQSPLQPLIQIQNPIQIQQPIQSLQQVQPLQASYIQSQNQLPAQSIQQSPFRQQYNCNHLYKIKRTKHPTTSGSGRKRNPKIESDFSDVFQANYLIYFIKMKFIVLLIAVALSYTFNPALAEDIFQYSRMAYCKEDKLYEWNTVAAQRHPNIQELQVFTNATHEAQGYCAYDQDNDRIIISIRGSDNLKNWIQNLNLFHTKYNKCKGCKVHHGFKNVYENLANNLQACAYSLNANHPNATLVVTGHSLGAAQATLAVLEINEQIKKVDIFYIYGSPRVGNKKFVEYAEKQLSHTFIARITHAKDPFIHLPTTWMGYKHLGYEIFLPGDSYQEYKVCYREDKGVLLLNIKKSVLTNMTGHGSGRLKIIYSIMDNVQDVPKKVVINTSFEKYINNKNYIFINIQFQISKKLAQFIILSFI